MNANGFPSAQAPDGANEVEAELVRVLDAYLAEVEAGRPPDPQGLIAAHPEIADRLRDCLGVLSLADHLADDPQDAKAADAVPGPDARLGDFRLLRQIGRGGMGVVYEAEQISLHRRVALKVMPFAAAFDPKQLQRFQLEAQAAACLHHTNIVPVHAVGTERGVPYYAMQLIEGQSLAEVIRDLRRLDGLEPADGLAPGLAGMSTSTLAAELLSRRSADRGRDAGSDTPTADHKLGETGPESPSASSGATPPSPPFALPIPAPPPAPASTSATSPASACKPPRPWTTPTPEASSTATSSPRTSCSTPMAASGSPTSASPRSRATAG